MIFRFLTFYPASVICVIFYPIKGLQICLSQVERNRDSQIVKYRVFHLIWTEWNFNNFYKIKFSNITKTFPGSKGQAYLMFLILNCSSLVLFELGLKVAAVHFDAQVRPGPDGSPDLLLVLWSSSLTDPVFWNLSITHLKFFLVGSFLGKCSIPFSFA